MVTSDHLDYKQHSSLFTLCGILLTPPGKCPKVSTVISDNVDVFTVKTDEYPASLLDKSSLSNVVMEDLTVLIYSGWYVGDPCGGSRSILKVVFGGSRGGWYEGGRGGY